jgi:hypothetical protein
MQSHGQKCALAIIATFLAFYLASYSSSIQFILLPFWYFIFRPWKKFEGIMVGIATLFFFVQNFLVLKSGGFSFKQQDILLMPWYEPFLWGFYYIVIKRFIADPRAEEVRLDWRAFAGLAVTGLCFSLFSSNSNLLLASTLISTGLLFAFFHEKYDFYYALVALVLGFAVEVFGVTTGLWWYPKPDFLGIPYWFATMWISVGVLGRRFLIPLSCRLANLLD